MQLNAEFPRQIMNFPIESPDIFHGSPDFPLPGVGRSTTGYLKNNKICVILEVGHLILRALAMRQCTHHLPMHSPRLVFTHPKVYPHPLQCDQVVATACQLDISPKTSSSCSSCTPLNHGQLSELQKYTSTFWQGIISHFQTYQRNMH